MIVELSAKRLQLLKEAIPRLTRVAVLWNPATPYHPKAIEDLKAAAPSLSIELTFRERTNARGVQSSILGGQPSARPGAVCDR